MASSSKRTTIPTFTDTRKRLCALKRGGESYDDLLQRMADQYDPDAHREGNDQELRDTDATQKR